MPVLNQFELAVDALASVRSQLHTWEPFIIPNYRLGLGVATSWNMGINHFMNFSGDPDVDVKYCLVINDDIVLAEHTLDHMVATMEANSDLAVLSATDYRNTLSPDDVMNTRVNDLEVDLIDAPDFACFMINLAAVSDIGYFDEAFTKAYFEDDDYTRRVVLHDWWEIRRSQVAMFYHYGSRTQNAGGRRVVSHEEFRANQQIYVEKWGGLPGKERYPSPYDFRAPLTTLEAS